MCAFVITLALGLVRNKVDKPKFSIAPLLLLELNIKR